MQKGRAAFLVPACIGRRVLVAARGPVAVLYRTASHKDFNYAFHSPLR